MSQASNDSSAMLPLHGLKVLDLSRVLAGPFATQQLLDLGAEVIKVEEPTRGDATRQWGPPFDEKGRSAYYLCCNRGKRSLALDLSQPRGRAVLERLVADVDLVVENFLPQVWRRWGLSPEKWRERHPQLVTLSISGFGSDGPWGERAGYDAVIQAMSGLMAVTGEADGEASKVGVAVVDVATGLFAATASLALLCAVSRRAVPAQARHVEVALFDAALALLANITSAALLTGEEPQRHGNAHPNIVPYQTFSTPRGKLVLGVGNDRQWRQLAEGLGRHDWLEVEEWRTNPGRVADRQRLVSLLHEELAQHDPDELVQRLAPLGIAIGKVNSVVAGLSESLVTARGLIQRHSDGSMTVASPARLAAGGVVAAAPPLLGADSSAVLADFGFSTAEIDQLLEAKVIREATS